MLVGEEESERTQFPILSEFEEQLEKDATGEWDVKWAQWPGLAKTKSKLPDHAVQKLNLSN